MQKRKKDSLRRKRRGKLFNIANKCLEMTLITWVCASEHRLEERRFRRPAAPPPSSWGKGREYRRKYGWSWVTVPIRLTQSAIQMLFRFALTHYRLYLNPKPFNICCLIGNYGFFILKSASKQPNSFVIGSTDSSGDDSITNYNPII